MATQPDIDLHSEEDAFREDVRQFLSAHFPEELKGKGNLLSAVEGPNDESEAERQWREAMGERGWGVPTWPKEYGGQGGNRIDQYIVEEEFARVGLSDGQVHENGLACFFRLGRFGGPDQRRAGRARLTQSKPGATDQK